MQRIKSISLCTRCRQTLNNPFLPNLHIIRRSVWELRDQNRRVLCDPNWLQYKTLQKRKQLLHFILWLMSGLRFGLSILGSSLASRFGAGVVLCADSPTWTRVGNHAKSVCVLPDPFTRRSGLRTRTCGSTWVFAQASSDTTHAITYAPPAWLHVTRICRRSLNGS